MHVVSIKRLREYWGQHEDARIGLLAWHKIASKARWEDINDVRKSLPTADAVKAKSGAVMTVFNIKGNHYRLITSIYYPGQQVYIKMVLTHAQYSKDQWKEQL
ncbi:MAG: type II toxin-antitoxin system HigB family toxin [Phycisphaeraceae bacterium JB051]